jgi:hypothetical protein
MAKPISRLLSFLSFARSTNFCASPPASCVEHLDHLLVGAAMERAPEHADARRDARKQIRLRAADDPHGARGAVLLVIGVQDQQLDRARAISGSTSRVAAA